METSNNTESSGNNSADLASTPAGNEPASASTAGLEAQLKEKESKYLYLYAEFENFKKRSIKERSELIKFGWESVARSLLDVLDNLNRAIEHAGPSTDKNLLEGLNMILNQFEATLEKQGVKEVETLRKPFDPNFNEAIAFEVSSEPSGIILKEHTMGYTLHGRLLRPARVTVSSGPGTATG